MRAKIRATSAGTAARVSRLTSIIVAKASGTLTAAGIADHRGGPAAEHVVGDAADHRQSRPPPDSSPPATSPHAAPAAVRPRHQMPSTSSGHRVDAATANTSPTVRDRSSDVDRQRQRQRDQPADQRGDAEVADPPAQHVGADSAPAMLTSRPDEVDRNAAMAPAATSAASSCPTGPPITEPGSSRTAASEVPVISSCGTYSRANTPSSVGNR